MEEREKVRWLEVVNYKYVSLNAVASKNLTHHPYFTPVLVIKQPCLTCSANAQYSRLFRTFILIPAHDLQMRLAAIGHW